MKIEGNNINNTASMQARAMPAPFHMPQLGHEAGVYEYYKPELPFFYTAGESQVHTKLPSSYSIKGEIWVPGLKDNARVHKLANGQRVITLPKKGSVFIKTTYRTGSLNEPDELRGISHKIEHNAFNGSRSLHPKQYDREVSNLGGDTNASTGFSATDYYLQVQQLEETSLEDAIRLNAELTQFPLFTKEQVENEKEPVKSEIDRCADNPDIEASCIALKNLFGIETKSSNFVIGTKENINSFTRGDLVDYFNTWYTPDNAVTVITGGNSHEETMKLAAKYYIKKSGHSFINKRYYEPLKYTDKPVRADIIRPNTEQPSITMAFAIPSGASFQDIDRLDVLSSLLQSKDTELYKALGELGASIDIAVENMQNVPRGAKALILTAYAPEKNLEKTIRTIYAEISKISAAPPDEEKVNHIKKRIINDFLSASESSERLNEILTNAALEENYNCFENKIKNTKAVTPQEISETAGKYLDLNKVSICVSHHKSASEQDIKEAYKSELPKKKLMWVSFEGRIKPVNIIRDEAAGIVYSRLPNNIETAVISGNEYAKPCLALDLQTDKINNVSCAELMVLNEMLNRGSGIKSADELNKILNEKDITLKLSADTDGIFAAAECPEEEINEALKLLKEKLLNPNFTEEEFKRAKRLAEDTLKAESISAYDKLYQEFYPELKIYEDKETRLKELEKLKLQDVQALFKKICSEAQARAFMSAADKPHLKDMFNNELSALGSFKPCTNKKEPEYNIYKADNKAEKILTAEREQLQAEIVQGYKFKISKNADDAAKISILNLILGAGGMSSRLFLDLREDKKLAYSTGTRLKSEKDTGVLSLRIDTTTESPNNKEGSPENVIKALEGFKRNVNRLKTENVALEELNRAKAKFKTQILNGFETNISKMFSSIDAMHSSYGADYQEELFKAADKLHPDDIRAAACYVFRNPPVISIAASRKTLNALNILDSRIKPPVSSGSAE